MKKAAVAIMVLAAMLALLALSGCKNEAMLENFSSDTYVLGDA